MVSAGEDARIDRWVWSVRLAKTRSMAAAACRAGHVKINGKSVKPAQSVRVGDQVRVRQGERERIVIVSQIINKRVGAAAAAECYRSGSATRYASARASGNAS
jgi:ribosome-associated heat shock protein Hsp15